MKDLKKKSPACGGREQAKWEKPTGAEYIKAYQEAEELLITTRMARTPAGVS